MSYAPELTVAGVMALGLSIVVPLVLRDWRALRDFCRALQAALRGTPVAGGFAAAQGGRRFEVRVGLRRNGPTLVELRVPGAVPHDLWISRRDAMDAAALGSGLVQRTTTGDAAFDARLWVQTSDAEYAQRWLASSRRREPLRRLFSGGVESLAWSTADQALIVTWPRRGPISEDLALVHSTMAWVVDSEPGLFAPQPLAAPPQQAAQVLRASHIHFIGAMAVFAFGILAAMVLDPRFEPVNRGESIGPIAALALPLFGLWAARSWQRMRAQLLGHRWWLPLLPVMALGCTAASYAALIGLNGGLDAAEPALHSAPIVALVKTPRDGTFDHYARTAGGEFQVSGRLWRQARVGDLLQVATHPGRLGLPWRDRVDDIVLVPAR